jgi:AraC-like DNA-binding protein
VSVEFQLYRPDLVRVTQQECDFGRWELASRGSHPKLRDYVIGYVGLRSAMRVTGERHLPSGEAALVVNLGTPHDVIGSGAQRSTLKFRSVAAMGVHDQPFVTRSAGAKHLLVVRLTPPGARLLFDVAMDQLFNRWVDLDDIDGVLARRIEERVHEPPGWNDLFDFMDSVMAERLAAARVFAPGVLWAWRELRRAGGLISIDSLADRLDWSHKRLLVQFREHVGVLPKATAEIVRFNKVLRVSRTDCRINWATVAQDCGYYDQAHMIREFKSFAGATMKELKSLVAGFTLLDRAPRSGRGNFLQ